MEAIVLRLVSILLGILGSRVASTALQPHLRSGHSSPHRPLPYRCPTNTPQSETEQKAGRPQYGVFRQVFRLASPKTIRPEEGVYYG